MSLDPGDYSVKDLREEVSEIEDEDELRDALEAEEEGDNRKTAISTIKQRINAVTEEADDEGGESSGGQDEEESTPNQGPSSRSSQIERL